MTGLSLGPDDGRETGLRMPRHVVDVAMETPSPPSESLLDEAIRQMFADYCAKVSAKADELAALGFALEEVQIGPDSDWAGNSVTMRLRGTYRIVLLPGGPQ